MNTKIKQKAKTGAWIYINKLIKKEIFVSVVKYVYLKFLLSIKHAHIHMYISGKHDCFVESAADFVK